MNKTNIPSLSRADTGIQFIHQEPCRVVDVDYKALETSSIDLISKLENSLAKAREMPKDDFVDEAAVTCKQMLSYLSEFTEEYLSGDAAVQSKQEIDRASTAAYAHEEVLTTRPLAKSIIRMFWEVAESDEIESSHRQLGQAIVRSCAATFYHAVMMIGLDSEFGCEIDQSTAVFVTELKQAWS